MKCLLCDCQLELSLKILDIFLMKEEEAQLCSNCKATFSKIGEEKCQRCSRKMDESSICLDCLKWQEKRGIIVQHQSLYEYNSAMKSYISRYKFFGDYLLRYAFASEIAQQLKEICRTYTLVPVPVSQERFKERGFNQVEGFLEAAKLPYCSLFGKHNEESKQSSRNRQERLQFHQGFYLFENVTLPQKICLIDDIYTTGVTLNTLREILFQKDIFEVKSFSLAR